jgi:nitrogen-specific signal transduction histidine kinase
MKLIFSDPDAPALFVDSAGLVQGANQAAQDLLHKTLENIVGQTGGAVMNCCNAALPDGCGKQEACTRCVLRNSVMDTHQTGNHHTRVKAVLPMDPGPPPQEMHLCVSTALHAGLVLVKVHELEMLSQAV